MIEKIKTGLSNIDRKDWMICILIALFMWQLVFKRDKDVTFDDIAIIENMKSIQKDVKALKSQSDSIDKRITRLKDTLIINSNKTIAIQKNLEDEKQSLNSSSDDDNVHYFHNYIIGYRMESK